MENSQNRQTHRQRMEDILWGRGQSTGNEDGAYVGRIRMFRSEIQVMCVTS